MKQLLVETFYPQWQIHEAEGNRPLRVSGLASVTDEINRNNRVYPTAVMAREVERMNENLSHSSRAGAVDHPYNAPVSVSDLGLKFSRVWMEGNQVMFEAEVIPTQRGRDLEAVIRAGINVGVSSRGMATIRAGEWYGRTAAIIQEDYALESFDCVVQPSVPDAQVRQYEMVERLAALPEETFAAIERLLTNASSGLETDSLDGVDMNPTAEELILRVQAAEGQGLVSDTEDEVVAEATAPVVADEIVVIEDAVEAEVAEESAVEATIAEPVAEEVVAEEDPRIAALTATIQERDERITLLSTEAIQVREDQNIQLALLALSSALGAELAEGDWESLARLAGIAGQLQWADYIDNMNDTTTPMEALKGERGSALVEKLLKPIGVAASRVARDNAIHEATKDELYGRRMYAIMRESCDTAAEVAEKRTAIRSMVVAEATGKTPLPEIRGQVESTSVAESANPLTAEQREMQRLARGY